ncbi:ABC transporter ATP-binding protein [Pelistega ratti]|uniref:ABC transporter ATP-binding protein n=1 Tax=Pelistega ratti TaxID=2652177 RepID=UPI00135BE3D8|nr:ABC transporter ATP-binding protein [Pelistega ratti]
MSAVTIEHLSKIYPTSNSLLKYLLGKTDNTGFQALTDISFSVKEGEFFGLLGPNGAGKSTLISILAGLSRPTTGTASILGFDVQKDYKQARRSLGVVPQEIVYDPFFTVRETLRNQSGYFGLRHNDDWIDEILSHLGLTEKADVNMRELSGGMKRRVLVAQALVHRPPVIILDEPTAGVDVDLRRNLWDFISHLNQKGHTIILTTHYLEEAQDLCERLAFIKKGQLMEIDGTENILKKYQTDTIEDVFVRIMQEEKTHEYA